MLQPADLTTWFGFAAQGDFGPYTMYTKVGGPIVMYSKADQDKTLTNKRLIQRNRFRAAASDWRAQTQELRDRWEAMSQKLAIPATGYNVWIHWRLIGDDDTIRTLERQSGIPLFPPGHG